MDETCCYSLSSHSYFLRDNNQILILIQTWRKGKNDELGTRGNIMIMIIIDVVYCWRALTLLPPPKKILLVGNSCLLQKRRYFLRFTIAGGLVDLPLWISTPHLFSRPLYESYLGFDLLLAAIQNILFAVRFVCMEYLFQAYMQAKSSVSSICLLLKTAHNIYSAIPTIWFL